MPCTALCVLSDGSAITIRAPRKGAVSKRVGRRVAGLVVVEDQARVAFRVTVVGAIAGSPEASRPSNDGANAFVGTHVFAKKK